jgi:hypothetical protein
MAVISVAVPRKGRPLEAVLERLATHTGTTDLVDEVVSTLRYEKAVTKGTQTPDRPVYDRLADYSTEAADYSLLRDSRAGFPRRIVFDALTLPLGDDEVRLVGREEPFRALRKHEFALGFDSADLVLEEVVGLAPDPLRDIGDVNDRIDPRDTDVRVVTGLGDTVYHTLLATPAVADGDLDRSFVDDYAGPVCISPRYERLVEAVVGTDALDGAEFCYPGEDVEEEAAIAEAGLGVYVTVTGSTAREHGLVVGERLFPSETVLLENDHELDASDERLKTVFEPIETELAVR